MNHIDSLSVIIPAYNEISLLRATTAGIIGELDDRVEFFEIIVVDDGSEDGSYEELSELSAAEPRIKFVRHARNRGKGSALRTGLEVASFTWVLFVDADQQVSLDELDAFDAAAQHADIVIGYRNNKKYTSHRKLISRLYNIFVKVLFKLPVRDIGCPFKLLRTDVVRSLHLTTDGFGFDVELLWCLSQAGFSFVELPVVSFPRRLGESKVNLKRIAYCLFELVYLRLCGVRRREA